MSTPTTHTFPTAAAHFGVAIRVLRAAIRAGRLPVPPVNNATATLPAEWVAAAEEALKTNPGALNRTEHQKTPAFARYPAPPPGANTPRACANSIATAPPPLPDGAFRAATFPRSRKLDLIGTGLYQVRQEP